MTDADAQVEAHRRWGPSARAWRSVACEESSYIEMRHVGIRIGGTWLVFGEGRTWEEAFLRHVVPNVALG